MCDALVMAHVCLQIAAAAPPAAAAGNPMMMGGMMDGMKGQIVFMVSQMLMYQWISTFFSGFLLRKCAALPSGHVCLA